MHPGGSRKWAHVDSIASARRIADSAIHDSSDAIHRVAGEQIRAIAVFIAGGEYGAAAPVFPVQEIGAKAEYPPGRSSVQVRLHKAVVGLARYAFLCSAPDGRGLTKEAIP